MKLSDFDYSLPEQLIAQYPLKKREHARLMVIDRAAGTMKYDRFENIANYLPERCMVVLNDSKVIPARLLGYKERTGGRVEVFLLRRLQDKTSFEALLRPLKRIRANDKIIFNGHKVYARLVDKENRIVRFNKRDILRHLDQFGHIPLPPYIRRDEKVLDKQYYQTVYARRPGSVASPTAGLHFTDRVLKKLDQKGHAIKRVTLHINYSTFEPVRTEDITKHQMHSEYFSMNKITFQSIKRAKEKGAKILAVGTTSCRVLETVATTRRLRGETDKFIYPGYQFRLTDCLLTNFHLPRSTLLMLVCAFATRELILHAYRQAIKKKFRFYSYGDCMLIL